MSEGDDGKLLDFKAYAAKDDATRYITRGTAKNGNADCRRGHSPIIDKQARLVECSVCGVELDPIDVLDRIAHNSDWVNGLVEARHRLWLEIEDLKKEVTLLKAQKRRAQPKQR